MEIAYRENFKKVVVFMFAVCLLSALLAYPALALWLSPEFAKQSLPIALILVVGIWFNSVALVPYTVLHASGDSRTTALLHLAELAVYIVALYWLTVSWGLVGAAVAWVGRVLLDLVLLCSAVEKYFKNKGLKKWKKIMRA